MFSNPKSINAESGFIVGNLIPLNKYFAIDFKKSKLRLKKEKFFIKNAHI